MKNYVDNVVYLVRIFVSIAVSQVCSLEIFDVIIISSKKIYDYVPVKSVTFEQYFIFLGCCIARITDAEKKSDTETESSVSEF